MFNDLSYYFKMKSLIILKYGNNKPLAVKSTDSE